MSADSSASDDLSNPINVMKCIGALSLLAFSISIVMGLIFNEETKISSLFHPVMAFCIIWASLIWLSMVEGGQASLVGLTPVRVELFKDTHPTTYKICKMVYEGDNFHRYLLGRQFMVVLLVFCINSSGSPLKGAELWGLPEIVTKIFLVSGLAMIFMTAMMAQLPPQVVASHQMLDFINNFFALFTVYVAMAVEFSGLLHASYVCQIIIHAFAGKPVESNEPPRTGFTLLFFWARCLMSCAVLGYCFAVTLAALFAGKTTMWEGVPPAVSVILFFVFMSIVGLLEGMQIAFFSVAKLRKEERGTSFLAQKVCEILFRGEGHNLPGFMIGRQLCVVSCFFVIARVTSLEIAPGESNVFNVSDNVQALFNTGLLGALITTIVGSIAWQLWASAFPIAFLGSPATYVFLRICLLLEATGVCSGAWVIGALVKKLMGAQRDEVYIGTAEERAANNMADNEENLQLGAGHIYKLPGFAENAPVVLKELMKSDQAVADYLYAMSSHMEKGSTQNDEATLKSVKSEEYA
jgi:Silicon transporter